MATISPETEERAIDILLVFPLLFPDGKGWITGSHMAFIGNRTGPRESEIVDKLGCSYFGITPAQLEYDIELWQESERGRAVEVRAVHVDENGQPYIYLTQANGVKGRFYLEEHGYYLRGSIKTFTEEEAEYWHRRSEQVDKS